MTSLSFSWSVDGILSILDGKNAGRLKKSGCVLIDVSGSLLTGEADCCRCSKWGYCCRNCELKFINADIEGVESIFCTKEVKKIFSLMWKTVHAAVGMNLVEYFFEQKNMP